MVVSFLWIGAFQGELKAENKKTRPGCAVRV
jgi:hypothetical protein